MVIIMFGIVDAVKEMIIMGLWMKVLQQYLRGGKTLYWDGVGVEKVTHNNDSPLPVILSVSLKIEHCMFIMFVSFDY